VSIEQNDFICCPHCKVCSIKLSVDELAQVEAGQQMIELCQVCGKEVYIHECI
jgi:hypothetical protein